LKLRVATDFYSCKVQKGIFKLKLIGTLCYSRKGGVATKSLSH